MKKSTTLAICILIILILAGRAFSKTFISPVYSVLWSSLYTVDNIFPYYHLVAQNIKKNDLQVLDSGSMFVKDKNNVYTFWYPQQAWSGFDVATLQWYQDRSNVTLQDKNGIYKTDINGTYWWLEVDPINLRFAPITTEKQ